MKCHDYIVSYDIADTRRLAKIAKIIERSAFRIQYSVYIYYDASATDLQNLLEEVMKIFDEEEDDLRIYRIESYGVAMGNAVNLREPFDIVG